MLHSFILLRFLVLHSSKFFLCFFFNDTATTVIYTLSLHDALPISFPAPDSRRYARLIALARLHGKGKHVTLEQLRVFVAVAERQHVTRAAAVLNLAQSAVSAAIAALEARYY